ncbi:MAG: Clp protease N-terminal domain-containing protein [Gemmatimonadaceae bacterium]|jgi:ATP-dependent Clp protease ATP-binding subunit ClpA|nr:Clp protease N-terminal domain-containing protein [Gemmatimonadaceae bacterium]
MPLHTYHLTLPLLPAAAAAARDLGHQFIAPEHLLLAVAIHADGASQRFFERYDLSVERLRALVADVLGLEAVDARRDRPIPIGQRALAALTEAVRMRRSAGTAAPPPAADALLVALLGDDVARGGAIGALLERVGVSLETARAELARP